MVTIPEALKTLEKMVTESAGLGVNESKVRSALDILEYLIPLFRTIKPDQETCARFVRIRMGVHQLLGKPWTSSRGSSPEPTTRK